jgi:hypothetical protein
MSYALYYPSIEFQDISTLKKSLFVWDRVFRIVPTGYLPNDTTEIREAIATGSVVNLKLDSNEKSEAANGFLKFYAERNDRENPLAWPSGFSLESFTRLNEDKIDSKLLPLFEQLAIRLTGDGFLEVPYELAGGYMFYLAKVVAEKRSLELLTDSADTWVVGSYFANNGNFDENVHKENAEAYLCNLAIDDLLPDTCEQVPMDELLRFVEEYAEERAAFQRELKAVREAISICRNKTHAEYIVGDLIKTFEKAKTEYRRAVGPFSKREVCSIFSVGLPVTMGFLSLPIYWSTDPYSALQLAIGTLLGAVSALAARESVTKEGTVASYLVSAEHLTRTPNGPLQRKFKEFVND